jgi:asparagine synthase (glutamine-hydrolysing)
MGVLNDEQLARLYTAEAHRAVPDDMVRRWFRERFFGGPEADAVGRAMHADLHSYLPFDINMKVDRATMACGLEARSPMLDHKVVEFAAGLPASWKLRRGPDGLVELKHLLKRAATGLLPQRLIDRPKMGFALPLRQWLAGPWAEFMRATLLGGRVAQRGIFHRSAIARLIEEHQRGKRDHAQRLWQLLFLELWLRQHFDSPPVRPAAYRSANQRASSPDSTTPQAVPV